MARLTRNNDSLVLLFDGELGHRPLSFFFGTVSTANRIKRGYAFLVFIIEFNYSIDRRILCVDFATSLQASPSS